MYNVRNNPRLIKINQSINHPDPLPTCHVPLWQYEIHYFSLVTDLGLCRVLGKILMEWDKIFVGFKNIFVF